MDGQLLLVIGSVLLALLYLGRQVGRSWRGQGASCGGCGHSKKAKTSNTPAAQTLIPVDQVRLRRH